MILDFSSDALNEDIYEYDICVIGAGAAGISIALSMIGAGLKVAILEAGGRTFPDIDGRDPYEGKTGEYPYPVASSRMRFLGGTTNHWGGWCRPLDEIDFEARDGLPLNGWPIKRKDLFPYYKKAHEICEIPSDDYDCEGIMKRNGMESGLLSLDGTSFSNSMFRFSPPTRFGKKYEHQLSKAENIDVFLNANVVSIAMADTKIDFVEASSLDGTKVSKFFSACFVLATGGLETARMLLNTNNNQAEGLGNSSGWVGHCFMDHFGFTPGALLSYSELVYSRIATDSGQIMPILVMDQYKLRDMALPNFFVQLDPIAPDLTINERWARNSGVLSGSGVRDFNNFRVRFIMEDMPTRESKVTLHNEKDNFGLARLKLDWKFEESNFTAIDRAIKLMAKDFGKTALGRVLQSVKAENLDYTKLSSGMHHIGTARMASSPDFGVVDSDCKVFDCDNLYLAGSSVFPSCGISNPTLTIVALALRLSEHLQKKINLEVI